METSCPSPHTHSVAGLYWTKKGRRRGVRSILSEQCDAVVTTFAEIPLPGFLPHLLTANLFPTHYLPSAPQQPHCTFHHDPNCTPHPSTPLTHRHKHTRAVRDCVRVDFETLITCTIDAIARSSFPSLSLSFPPGDRYTQVSGVSAVSVTHSLTPTDQPQSGSGQSTQRHLPHRV